MPYATLLLILFRSAILLLPSFYQGQLTPIGGEYYRDSTHVYVREKAASGGFINLTSDTYSFEEVIGADAKTFVVLQDGYAKDRNYVYQGQRLDNVDVRSFKSIGNGFYRDKNDVRWGSVLELKRLTRGSKPESFDPYSFEVLPCGFARDKTGVYVFGSHGDDLSEHNQYHKYDFRIDVLDRIDIVDAKTFEIVREGGFTGCEAKDKNFIYRTTVGSWTTGMMSEPHQVKIIAAVGSEKFENLDCAFVSTPSGIFWNDELVNGADAATFEVLVKKGDKECGYGFYAKDKRHVYYQSHLIEGADPETFQVLDTVWSYCYAFDKAHQYSQGNNIKHLRGPEYEMKNFNDAYDKWKQSRSSPK